MVPAHRRQRASPTVLQSRGAQSLTSSQVRLSGYPGPWPGPEVAHAWPFYEGVTSSVVIAEETVVPLFGAPWFFLCLKFSNPSCPSTDWKTGMRRASVFGFQWPSLK